MIFAVRYHPIVFCLSICGCVCRWRVKGEYVKNFQIIRSPCVLLVVICCDVTQQRKLILTTTKEDDRGWERRRERATPVIVIRIIINRSLDRNDINRSGSICASIPDSWVNDSIEASKENRSNILLGRIALLTKWNWWCLFIDVFCHSFNTWGEKKRWHSNNWVETSREEI